MCLNGIGAFFAVATLAAATPPMGYLPLIGPAPLRFLAVIVPSTNFVALPPTAPAPVPESVSAQKAKAAILGPQAPSPDQVMEAKSPDAGSALPNGSPFQQAPDQLPPDAVISPQMLLKYFSRNTNGPASVVAPVNFNPPKAPVLTPPNPATPPPGH